MKEIRAFIIAFVVFLTLTVTASAEDIYVAQNALGSDNGMDCANAHSMAWLNVSGNWGSDSGKISAGDTVHLCGTFTTALSVAGSGFAGSPVVILFEPGAKFSKNTWGIGGSAVTISSKSYITIDGGSNGIIEATDVGTARTYKDNTVGIYISGSNNIIIKNLTIQNMYVRTPNSTDFTVASNSIKILGGSYLYIHDNIMSNAYGHINGAYSSGSSHWYIYNNTMTNTTLGVAIGDSGSGASLDVLEIYGNNINLGTAYSFPSGEHFHCDCIQIFCDAGVSVKNAKIYSNTLGPTTPMKTSDGTSATSAWIRVESRVLAPIIYNNLILADSNSYPTDAYIEFGSTGVTQGKIYNNTVSAVHGTCFANGSGVSDGLTEIKNNICLTDGYAVNLLKAVTSASQIDYNVYYGPSSWVTPGYAMQTWSSWRALGYDGHGKNQRPSLDGSYAPTSSDTVAKDAGVNLSSYFTTDKNDGSRPIGSAWDVGAFEGDGGGTLSPPGGFRLVP